MKAVLFDEFGPPEVLRLGEADDPEPAAGEVRLKVAACGVCRHDALHRAGKLPGSAPGLILGHEIAGTVERLGEGTQGLVLGQPAVVYHKPFDGTCAECLRGRTDACLDPHRTALHYRGGYGEMVCVPAKNVLPLPDGADLVRASVLPCALGTSLRALHAADAAAGQSVAVIGAAGGLGAQQVQLAHALGLDVIAVTRSDRWHRRLRELGARHCIAAPGADFSRAVKEATGGRGVDVVLENVVSSTLNASLRSLAKLGTAVLMGNLDVADISIRPGLFIYRRLRMIGSGGPTLTEARELVGMFGQGIVAPVVAAVLPHADAAQAHRLIERGGQLGRVVLT
jgi:acryloyl-coenzyme A reductase